nr:MAG TPA: hypothetical protein [Caudoviricetes sp.]
MASLVRRTVYSVSLQWVVIMSSAAVMPVMVPSWCSQAGWPLRSGSVGASVMRMRAIVVCSIPRLFGVLLWRVERFRRLGARRRGRGWWRGGVLGVRGLLVVRLDLV